MKGTGAQLAAGNGVSGISFKVGDEITPLVVATGLITLYAQADMTITDIFGGLTAVGSTAGVTTVDINVNGITILSTKLTINFGDDTSLTAAIPLVISSFGLVKGDKLTVDIDGLTTGETEAGLEVIINTILV